jgi:hypothetical protein
VLEQQRPFLSRLFILVPPTATHSSAALRCAIMSIAHFCSLKHTKSLIVSANFFET